MDAYDLNETPHYDETDAIVYCDRCGGSKDASDTYELSGVPCPKCDGTGAITLAEHEDPEQAIRYQP
jgi:DnaJ-class molecular chaperone